MLRLHNEKTIELWWETDRNSFVPSAFIKTKPKSSHECFTEVVDLNPEQYLHTKLQDKTLTILWHLGVCLFGADNSICGGARIVIVKERERESDTLAK